MSEPNLLRFVASAAAPMGRGNLLERLGATMPDPGPAPVEARNATPLRPQGVGEIGRNYLAQMAGQAPSGVAANTVMGFAASPAAIRAFHGSPHRFDRFDISRAGSTTDAGDLGRALYFTTDGKTAMAPPFAGEGTRFPNRYEVNVRAENPLEISMRNWGDNKRHLVRDALGLPRDATAEAVTEAARARGHDSVRLDYSPVNYHSQELAVFDDSLIDIVRRYGLLGLIGGGAAAGGAEAAAP